jgi:YVTN family beta-propeller protein
VHRLGALVLLGLGLTAGSAAWAADEPPLQLEAKIALGKVSGRIDHLAVDLARQRLFVAELGNDSVGVIDLKERKLASTISGLRQPQGVGYKPSTDTLYVANAGDGSVRLFQGAELNPTGRIDLGEDADNIRIDAAHQKVIVGYGNGALAGIDPVSRAKVGDIPLAAHPEGFQLESSGSRIFVNLPDARQIAVAARLAGKVSAKRALKDAGANFPMAIDEDEQLVLVVFRKPAKLAAFAFRDGSIAAMSDSCGDADDVFVDSKRHRVYVSCGEGLIDVFSRREGGYDRVGRVPTVRGARTSFLAPTLDRLFLAVRAGLSEPAAIWVYRPTP